MLSPHELKNKEFSKSLRGYSTEEVDEHIAFIIERYTELFRAYDELEKKLRQTEAKLDSMKAEEDSIRSALVNAQKASKTIIDDANEQADVIMRSAKTNCDRLIAELKTKVKEEQARLDAVKNETQSFKASLFKVYNTHINAIESIAPDVDSSKVSAERVNELSSIVVDRIKEDLDKLNPVITGSVSPYEEENDEADADITIPAEVIIPEDVAAPAPSRVTTVRDADQISFDEIDEENDDDDASKPESNKKTRDAGGENAVDAIKKLNSEIDKNSRDEDEEFLKLLRMASGKGDMTSTQAFESDYDEKTKTDKIH